MTELLSSGNSAKLYCLNLIEEIIQKRGEDLIMLDLGCGTAANFVSLLSRYPRLRYIGVEPSASECEVARKNLSAHNASIINSDAYNLNLAPADIIISFSVLEHVYRREAYMRTVKKHLKQDGLFLINYDSGHFVHTEQAPFWAIGSDRWKNRFGAIFAWLGSEKYFQRFVREVEFQTLLTKNGLQVLDEKVFNTDLKSIYKFVPSASADSYMSRWLEFELYLNNIGISYTDALAKYFRTRNFVFSHHGLEKSLYAWLRDNG